MKLQHIAAALALVATGAANAAVQGGTNGDGSLFLIAFDNQNGTTTSAFFDLGYTLNSFASAAGNGSSSALGVLAAPNTTVVWNFNTNTVSLNGGQVTTLGTNSWNAAFTTLLANADQGEIQWVVGANDTVGFGANKRSLISGNVNATAQQREAQNAGNNSNLALITNPQNNDIFYPLTNKGTIGSADNGAYTFTAADGPTTRSNGYVMAGDGFGNNWRNANKMGGTVYAGQENGLWLADGLGNEQLVGRLVFSAEAGTLTFVTTPVPEPSTYAMALLGLGVVGLMARRRRA
ncbi:MAG: PEP-CTERM sorting domain-containing protein [Aquabacterium sp.]|jgi:hypothetical protein|uniref:PEP-CTERM sorting domain-containing protein n=1 Tax=Aquabacterium sp. TaxID=1872578 RepID=UPI003BAF1B92